MNFPILTGPEPRQRSLSLKEYGDFLDHLLEQADPVKLQRQKEAEEVIERPFSLAPSKREPREPAQALKHGVDVWRRAGPELARLRAAAIREADTAAACRSFEGLLPSILARSPPQPTSGLVEQQRYFARLRRE